MSDAPRTTILHVSALDAVAEWPVPNVAATVVGPAGTLAEHGDVERRFPLASVTKLLVARAAHVAGQHLVQRTRSGRALRKATIGTATSGDPPPHYAKK